MVVSAISFAALVPVQTAQTTASYFYSRHSSKVPASVALVYTDLSASGEALYYIFNVNNQDGFVIVAAEDASFPILGFSDSGQFPVSNQSPELS